MAWFKVDDTLPMNMKVRSCSLEAIGLWTLAGAWASQQLTGGFIPKQMLQALALGMLQGASDFASRTDEIAQELASSGLWIAHTDGYQFHDWEEYQPDAISTKETRRKRQEAGRIGGLRSGEARRSKTEANASSKSKQTLEPRPVPSRPNKKQAKDAGEPADFTAFYDNAYPKKVDRKRALIAWNKAVKEVDPQTLIREATNYAASTAGTDPKYIKAPASWLNAGSWENEVQQPPTPKPILTAEDIPSDW